MPIIEDSGDDTDNYSATERDRLKLQEGKRRLVEEFGLHPRDRSGEDDEELDEDDTEGEDEDDLVTPLAGRKKSASKKIPSKRKGKQPANLRGQMPDGPEEYPLTPGCMPKEGILKALALGERVESEARTIGREYGKSVQTVLSEAGLFTKLMTRADSMWNMHQTWYAANFPKNGKGMSIICDTFN
jgi:hypothetical protein